MLGHRTLEADDYIDILKRRKWMLLIPTILLPILAIGATFFLSPKYTSQTLVLIEEQKVPDEYVKPVISSDLDSRLASMKEQILSRSRIQPIIERYDLFAGRGVTMDDRIDLARKGIAIKPIHSEIAHSGGLPGFFISFTANDAHTAQLVCGEITSLFVSENLRSRQASAVGTTDFLKGQLDDAKRSLDEQDAKLAAFQRQFSGKLPGEESPNMNMMTSLNTQLDSTNQAITRMEQDKSYGEAMLAQLVAQNTAASAAAAAPGTTAPVAPETRQRELDALQAQETDLLTHYTPSYPDVVTVRRRIAELRKEMAAPVVPPATVAPAAGSATPAPSRFDSPAVQQLRLQLRATDTAIQSKRQEQVHLQSQLGVYQERIQSSPQVAEQYKELTRDYQTAETFYNDLLTKMNHSKMATDLERRQQGEQFTIMDQPNLPDAPSFPKRNFFGLGGLVAGLMFGLILGGIFEYKDTALRTERDVYAFTGLPTLAVIAFSPAIKQDNEKNVTPKPKAARMFRLRRQRA